MNNSPENVSEMLSFAVDNGGLRLDAYVSQMCELTRSAASKLVENGNVTVDMNKCVACGKCAKICPKGIISVEYASLPCYVGCSNTEKGAVARKHCSAACIGCKKCEKVCEAGAVTVENFKATVDPAKCTGCGLCTEACPQGTITSLIF